MKALTDAAGHQADDAGDDPDAETGEDDEAAEGEWASLPSVLLLDSPEYDEELRALIEWVEGVLVPGYLAEPSVAPLVPPMVRASSGPFEACTKNGNQIQHRMPDQVPSAWRPRLRGGTRAAAGRTLLTHDRGCGRQAPDRTAA
ncbi:hypothetical protein [Streptomyces collinus]|uniref:hypothetical protein n=1 Tax=Streptomyces collinus TaxID=42684 RepID=UPI003685EB15